MGKLQPGTTILFAAAIWWSFALSPLMAQPRVQFPNYGGFPSTGGYAPGGYAPGGVGIPVGTPGGFASPAPSAGSFDPYFRPIQPTNSWFPQNWNLGNLFGTNTSAPVIPLGPANYPTYVPSNGGQPWSNPGVPQWGQPLPNNYPSNIYPGQPSVLFPGSGNQPATTNWNYNSPFNWGNGQGGSWWNNWWNNTSSNLGYGSSQVMRVFQGARLRHTWLSGTSGFNDKSASALEINDTDASLVFALPNFLNSSRSLYIIPSYSHHTWDGPKTATSDLPSNAFSGFIDSGWDSNPSQTLGFELGVRVGVFSDFDAISSDSIYVQGKGVGRLRLTPNATAKLGAIYLDRNKVKLLPVVGVLWSPNQDSRFDFVFPEPKLSHYVSTIGNTDMWWYLTSYYGGGSWTIRHSDGVRDEIDINDIRVMIGLEFGRSDQMRQGFRLGFIEAGYAFNRELLYRFRQASNLEPEDSIVIRGGFSY